MFLGSVSAGGVFALSIGADTPLDWRASPDSHRGFERTEERAISLLARATPQNLELGFSSEDWIEDGENSWLVDVKPVGQWLVLPDDGEIAEQVAYWLDGRADGATLETIR